MFQRSFMFLAHMPLNADNIVSKAFSVLIGIYVLKLFLR